MRNPPIAAALLLALSFGLTACGGQYVPIRVGAVLEGDGWVDWSELATLLAEGSDEVAALLRRFPPVEVQRSAED